MQRHHVNRSFVLLRGQDGYRPIVRREGGKARPVHTPLAATRRQQAPSLSFVQMTRLRVARLHPFACNNAGKFDPKCVIRSPERAAISDIIPSNLKHKFVGDGGSADTRNLGAAV
jgi:hypothetical protein